MSAVSSRLLPRRVAILEPFTDCPQVVFGRIAARSAAFGANPAGGGAPVVIGSAAGSCAAVVRPRALGELTERVSNILAGRRVEATPGLVATFEQLRRRGNPALDPASLAGLRFSTRSRAVPMRWVRGRSLLSGAEISVPAAAVYLGHRPPQGCPPVGQAGSTGLAAHPSRSLAVRHALLEILERDLLGRAWYGSAHPLRLSSAQLLPATLRRTLQELTLEATAFIVPGPAQTACVAVCVHTGSGQEQSFGARTAAGRDPRALAAAAEIAVYEALMVRWSMRSPVAEQAWGAMRARPGPDAPRNMLEHAVLAFHRTEALGFWLDRSVPAPAIPTGSHAVVQLDEHQLAGVLAEHIGADIVVVDTTIAEVAAEGCHVIRIVAAGAHQLPNDERAVIPPDPARQRALPHPFG